MGKTIDEIFRQRKQHSAYLKEIIEEKKFSTEKVWNWESLLLVYIVTLTLQPIIEWSM